MALSWKRVIGSVFQQGHMENWVDLLGLGEAKVHRIRGSELGVGKYLE